MTSLTDLRSEVEICPPATNPDYWRVRRLRNHPLLAVARDYSGRRAFVFASVPGAQSFRSSLAEFQSDVNLVPEGETEPFSCAILSYDVAVDGPLNEVLPALAWGLNQSQHCGPADALNYVNALSVMLRDNTQSTNPKVVQGTWGELLVIAASESPGLLIDAWHDDPDETYDFAFQNSRLEVKTTLKATRHHHFSSAQVPGTPGKSVLIQSVMTQRVAGGWTAWDLVQSVRARVSTEIGHKLLQKALAVLNLQELALDAFDARQATREMKTFSVGTIPRVSVHPGVLVANWVADCSDLGEARVPESDPFAPSLKLATLPHAP